LWDGINFNTPNGQAPNGAIQSVPVADNPSTVQVLDSDWGSGQASSSVGSDTFSARWKGNFTFKAGTYTFFAGADDGVRLRVDGVTIIDSWIDSGYFERSAQRTFATQGVHNIEMDYYENGGGARASLRWTFSAPPPPNLYVNNVVLRRNASPANCSNGTVVTSGTTLNNGELLEVCVTYGNNGLSSTGSTYLIDNYIHQPSQPAYGTAGHQSYTIGPTPVQGPSTLQVGSVTVSTSVCATNCRAAVFIDRNNTESESNEADNFATSVNYNVNSVDLNFDDASSELQFYSDGTYTTPKTTFAPNETMYVQVRIRNTGADAITTPFLVGFYLEPGSSPSCGQAPSDQKQVTSLAAGAIDTWQFTINAPATQGAKIAYAFADYQCGLTESNENNNIRSRAYNVDVNAWIETNAGDVGSQGQITAEQAPPNSPQKYNSSYLLAGSSLDAEVTTQSWRLNNYNRRLVPTGGTYNYLAERFRSKATGADVCVLPASLPSGDSFYQCTGDATFNAGSGPGGNNVFFIDGNLTINGNLTLGASDTATFIVRGNINLANAVTRIDGIYVAGGTFTSGSGQGQQLLVNGAVYANGVALGRVLAPSGCGVSPCDNLVNPAERIVFDPKFIIGLNSLLGSPSFAWREVAP
jgi:hypothetical protein